MHFIFFVALPEPNLKYYYLTIEPNKPVLMNCSVSALPCPEFQWIQANSEKLLSESSWNSKIYVEKTCSTTSTLNYTFERTDLNEYCKIPIMCIATNPYGRSEQYFILSFNNSENINCSQTSTSETVTYSSFAVTLLLAAISVTQLVVIAILTTLVIKYRIRRKKPMV